MLYQAGVSDRIHSKSWHGNGNSWPQGELDEPKMHIEGYRTVGCQRLCKKTSTTGLPVVRNTGEILGEQQAETYSSPWQRTRNAVITGKQPQLRLSGQ